jgi:murein DD-endopeptidase MepM/ murein hydrolase activator NlpD
MANRFYTVMIVPEKTDQVRKILIPAWVLRGTAVALAFVTLLGIVMVLDYWYVMSQIGENKQLKLDNRKLRQQVQVFRNKMTTIDSTMERIKTFATRLKVITNIEDRGGLLQSLNQRLPDAGTNTGAVAKASTAASAPASAINSGNAIKSAASGASTGAGSAIASGAGLIPAVGPGANPSSTNTASGAAASGAGGSGNPSGADSAGSPSAQNSGNANADAAALATSELLSPEDTELRAEYELLDMHFSELNRETMYVEQMLQDQYELLADQKSFLAALPTRKPAIGYFTSGFGIRRSPFGGRTKMHEGLDIANRPGTAIKAPADGVVTFANTKSGYGQTVILDHGYGLETWYGHTRKITVVKGAHVKRGDTVALLGNSGRSTGPHVHYEVRVHGTPVDPLSYILEN